jgi:class 3 adenylate cyclase
MNTASRMESNGTAGKIHVSQATAEELIHQGKSPWVKPRQDKVMAKGKGELQTYWVSVRDNKAAKTTAMACVRDFGDDSNNVDAAVHPSFLHSDEA